METNRDRGVPPEGRYRHTVMLDAELNFYVLFGEGAQRAHFNDVWKIDLAQSLYESGAVQVEITRDPESVAVQWMPRDRTFLADRFNGILPVYQVYRSPDLNTWEAIGDPVDANVFQPVWHYSVVDPSPARNKFHQVRAVFAE